MVAIIADTHMPKGDRELPAGCLRLLEQAELIVPAGDWSGPALLERLEGLGPGRLRLTANEQLRFELVEL